LTKGSTATEGRSSSDECGREPKSGEAGGGSAVGDAGCEPAVTPVATRSTDAVNR
jgi:hypothetical protein